MNIIVDDAQKHLLTDYNWCVDRRGFVYARRTIGKKRVRYLLHRLVTACPPGLVVDHVNGNRLDNRKTNLRVCTITQNTYNRKPTKNNGIKGVYFSKPLKKWQAHIRVDWKKIHLGTFNSVEEASKAYNNAAKQYFGEFARLNC